MDTITYALCKKAAASAVSGVKSMSVDGQTLIINTKDSGVLKMVFPTPSNGVSVTDIDVNDKNQIVFTMSDGTKITSGVIPTVKGADGKSGKDAISPTIIENADNTDTIYKLDVTTVDGTFTTPNLRGKDGKNGSGSSIGEENVIESIKVNGVVQTVADDKSVDITVPTVDVNKNYVDTELAKKANISDIPSLNGYVTDEELNAKGYLTSHQDISDKVDKVKGKSLIADTEIERLKSVKNYDDTEIKTELAKKANSTDVTKEISDKIAEVISDAPESFDTLKEISDWISGHENDASAMNSAIKDNKSAITTLQTDKANKAEIPTVPTNVSEFTNDAGYLTEHQDISNLVVKEKGKGLSSNDYTSEEKTKLGGVGTSQGRNLISYPYYNGTSYESNGVTYTVNEVDGTITVNGTATKESDFRLISPYDTSDRKTLELGQTYTLSDGVNKMNGSGYQAPVYFQFVRIDTTKNDFNYGISTNYGDMTWTASDANLLQYGIRIVVRNGVTVDNVVLKPMLEIGAITHSYEPTTESNVNLKETIKGLVTPQGKNLISYPYTTKEGTGNGITWTVNDDGTITADGTATNNSFFNLTNYIVGKWGTLRAGTYTIMDGVNLPIGGVTLQVESITGTQYKNKTFTIEQDVVYKIFIYIPKGTVANNITFKPMLEIGSIAHIYEPTTESNISLKSAIDGKVDKSKVADVNWTSVDISNVDENTNSGATLYYCIKNGICYMSILNIRFKTANQAIILEANSIPKPSSNYCWSPLVGVTDPSYSVLIHPNASGGLEHHSVGLTSQLYSGLFSYPVAES